MHTLLAQNPQNQVNFGISINPPTNAYSNGSAADTTGVGAAKNLETFLSNIIGLVTVVAGIFFILYFVLGGLNWIMAGGDSAKITKAREQMIQGVMGMVIIAISYGVLGVLSSFLGLHLLNPGHAILQLAPNPNGVAP